jgi:hypothetical protein
MSSSLVRVSEETYRDLDGIVHTVRTVTEEPQSGIGTFVTGAVVGVVGLMVLTAIACDIADSHNSR